MGVFFLGGGGMGWGMRHGMGWDRCKFFLQTVVVFWCLTTTAGFKVHLVELNLFNFIAATASVVQIELLVYNTVVH